MKLLAWVRVKRSRVQILVVVAIIQVRSLKTEVEKGSMWTVFEHGLVGPKRTINLVIRRRWLTQILTQILLLLLNISLLKRKGIRLTFLNLKLEIRLFRQHKVVTQAISETSSGVSGRVIFSLYTYHVPRIRLSGERDVKCQKHRGSCGVRSAPGGPWKSEGAVINFISSRTDIRSRSPRWAAYSLRTM